MKNKIIYLLALITIVVGLCGGEASARSYSRGSIGYMYTRTTQVDRDGNETYLPKTNIPIKNQGRTDKCVAYAISSLYELNNHRRTGRYKKLDPSYVYKKGSRGRIGMYLVKTVNKLKGDRIYGNNGCLKTRSINSIKSAIKSHHGILVDIKTDRYFDKTRTGVLKNVSNRKTGSHTMVVTGYKYMDGKYYLRVQNSWGRNWGDNGICWMPIDYKNINYFYIIRIK